MRITKQIQLIYWSLFVVLFTQPLLAVGPDYSKMPVPQLIDALQEIDQQTVGLHGTLWLSAFIAESKPPQIGGGVFGSPPPIDFEQMRELVRRGATVLPELIRHIEDARRTKLVIGNQGFPYMACIRKEEYDPRNQDELAPKQNESAKNFVPPEFISLPYTVTVGDVCFALVGQITNRSLRPVRYQPSGILVVNSPSRSKALARKVRSDWASLTPEQLQASLVNDAARKITSEGALARLRFYFPQDYEKQKQGKLRQAIEAFEANHL